MSHIYILDGIIFDSSLCSLSFSEETIKLGFKEAALLSSLCERPFKVVERDELQETLWNGGTGAETNLNRAIYILRKKLSSLKSDNTEIIETIPRVGYILKCKVEIKFECEQSRTQQVTHTKQSFEGCSINTAMINNGSIHNENALYNNTKQNNYISTINHCLTSESNRSKTARTVITIVVVSAITIILFYLFGSFINSTLSHQKNDSVKIVKLGSQGKIYTSKNLKFIRSNNLERKILEASKDMNIKYISLGTEYLSLYQQNGDSNRIYYIREKEPTLNSLYNSLTQLQKKSSSSNAQNKVNCVVGNVSVLTNKGELTLCINRSSRIISSDLASQTNNIITMNVEYYTPDGMLIAKKTLLGDLIKRNDNKEATLKFQAMDFPIIISSEKTASYLSKAGEILMYGWNEIGKKFVTQRVFNNLYYSEAIGGRLVFIDDIPWSSTDKP